MYSAVLSDGGVLSRTQRAELLTHNYFYLVGITILYYDHMMTLSDEYTRIWRAPRSVASICFLLVRYIAVLTTIASTYAAFGASHLSTESCTAFALLHQVALMATQLLVAGMQFLRIYALYSRSKRIAAFMIGVAVGILAVAVWIVTHQAGGASLHDGCWHMASSSSSKESSAQLSGLWVGVLVYDTMIFLLTVFKTHQGWLKHRMTEQLDILSLMYRDGTMNFGAIIIAHGINVATFYLLPPALQGVTATAASSVSVAMISRLTLNLHGLRVPKRTTLLPCSSSESAEVNFTTGISISQRDSDALEASGH